MEPPCERTVPAAKSQPLSRLEQACGLYVKQLQQGSPEYADSTPIDAEGTSPLRAKRTPQGSRSSVESDPQAPADADAGGGAEGAAAQHHPLLQQAFEQYAQQQPQGGRKGDASLPAPAGAGGDADGAAAQPPLLRQAIDHYARQLPQSGHGGDAGVPASASGGGDAEGAAAQRNHLLRQACDQYVRQLPQAGRDVGTPPRADGGWKTDGKATRTRPVLRQTSDQYARQLPQGGRLGAQADLQAPAEGVEGESEGWVHRPRPLLQQALEQYVERAPGGGGGPAEAARSSDPLPGYAPGPAEATAALGPTARWSRLAARCSARARGATALSGRLLLAHARSPGKLARREERVLTSLLLREPAWIATFPELALQCREQLAARLGIQLGTQGHPSAGIRRAGARPGSASQRSAPSSCGRATSGDLEGFRVDLMGSPAPQRAWVAPSFQNPHTLDSIPEMPAHRRSDDYQLQTMDSMPGMPDQRRPEDYQVRTLESIASVGDPAGMTGLQTLDSLPEIASPDMPWRHNEPSGMDDLRTLDSLPDMAPLDAMWQRNDPYSMPRHQSVDSLPDMVAPEAAMFHPTADSLPDIMQSIGPPTNFMITPPFAVPHFAGSACGSAGFDMPPPTGYGGRPPFGSGLRFQM